MQKQARKQVKELLDVGTLMHNQAIVGLLAKSLMTDEQTVVA